jgi:hypothetical protein
MFWIPYAAFEPAHPSPATPPLATHGVTFADQLTARVPPAMTGVDGPIKPVVAATKFQYTLVVACPSRLPMAQVRE